jgi:hypothetical protein
VERIQVLPIKNTLTGLRYSLAAPFSKVYSIKRRWLRERDEWEALGIAQTDMRRKIYSVPHTGAVCITVSKCANTTLKFMLHGPDMDDPRGVHAKDHLLTRLIDSGLTLNDLSDGSKKIFTFARHPVSRFWSGYLTRVFDRRKPNAITLVISSRFKLPISNTYPPETVLEYIRSTSPIDIDEHLRPQWACTGIERLPINFIGRVETMNHDVMKLLEMGYLDQGQAQRYQHLNKSSTRDIPDKARIDKIIRDVYAKDMELFGYE